MLPEHWPRCPHCNKKLRFLGEDEGWGCLTCDLKFQVDRGEVSSPMLPGVTTRTGEEVSAEMLSEEEFERFLEYLEAQGIGKENYFGADRKTKKSMIQAWLKRVK